MADLGVIESATEPPPLHPELGTELGLLLASLSREGLAIGPREHIAATRLLAHLAAQPAAAEAQQPRRLFDYRHDLAPLLSRSADERRRVLEAMASLAPDLPPPRLPTPPLPPKPPIWLALLVALVLVGAGALGWRWLHPPVPATKEAAKPDEGQPSPLQADAVSPNEQDNDVLADTGLVSSSTQAPLSRLRAAAGIYGGVATPAELAHALAPTSPVPDEQEYLRRLVEFAQLPPDRPVAVPTIGASDSAAIANRRGARLAEAISMIEVPGQGIDPAVPEAFGQPGPQPSAAPVALAGRWLTKARAGSLEPAIRNLTFAQAVPWARRTQEVPGATDDATIGRALAAAAPNWSPPDAPWLRPVDGARAAPFWLGWLVAAAAMLLFLPWVLGAQRRRKAFLRRRPPRSSPLRTPLFTSQPHPAHDARLYRRIVSILQRREARTGTGVDVDATIAASVRAGGAIALRRETIRTRPEYLALIERLHRRDQQADSVADLLRPLRGIVATETFGYQGDPAHVDPEPRGGAVRIEALAASHSFHRLLLFGSGTAFVDPLSGNLRPSIARLAGWRRRAMLSTRPVASWGGGEAMLADRLAMPLGRATSGGLAAIAECVASDAPPAKGRFVTEGDDGVPPLPPLFERRMARLLAAHAPERGEIAAIVAQLRHQLDPQGFDWLCALAVYPALDYALTIHLGQALRARTPDGGDAPLFTEARLAALTQLPWLRAGRMPAWMRRALIVAFEPRRHEEVRQLILRLIEDASKPDEAPQGATAGRDEDSDPPPSRLMEDEVLLDFLALGAIEDFALPAALRDRQRGRRGLSARLGRIERGLIAVALLFAAVALLVTPGPGNGPPGPAAWRAPILLLLLAAALPAATMLPQQRGLGDRFRLALLAAGGAAALLGLAVVLVIAQTGGYSGEALRAADGAPALTARDDTHLAYVDEPRHQVLIETPSGHEEIPPLAVPDGQRAVALAVDGAGPSSKLVGVAVVTEDGQVAVRGSQTGEVGHYTIPERFPFAVRVALAAGGPALLAYASPAGAHLVALSQVANSAVTATAIPIAAPVTALVHMGGRRFVFALADGRVSGVDLGGARMVRFDPQPPRLAAGARLIVPERQDPKQRFLAVADDGSMLAGRFSNAGLTLETRRRAPALARGPVVTWQPHVSAASSLASLALTPVPTQAGTDPPPAGRSGEAGGPYTVQIAFPNAGDEPPARRLADALAKAGYRLGGVSRRTGVAYENYTVLYHETQQRQDANALAVQVRSTLRLTKNPAVVRLRNISGDDGSRTAMELWFPQTPLPNGSDRAAAPAAATLTGKSAVGSTKRPTVAVRPPPAAVEERPPNADDPAAELVPIFTINFLRDPPEPDRIERVAQSFRKALAATESNKADPTLVRVQIDFLPRQTTLDYVLEIADALQKAGIPRGVMLVGSAPLSRFSEFQSRAGSLLQNVAAVSEAPRKAPPPRATVRILAPPGPWTESGS